MLCSYRGSIANFDILLAFFARRPFAEQRVLGKRACVMNKLWQVVSNLLVQPLYVGLSRHPTERVIMLAWANRASRPSVQPKTHRLNLLEGLLVLLVLALAHVHTACEPDMKVREIVKTVRGAFPSSPPVLLRTGSGQGQNDQCGPSKGVRAGLYLISPHTEIVGKIAFAWVKEDVLGLVDLLCKCLILPDARIVKSHYHECYLVNHVCSSRRKSSMTS